MNMNNKKEMLFQFHTNSFGQYLMQKFVSEYT